MKIIKTQFGQCYQDCEKGNYGDFSCPQKLYVRVTKNGKCLDRVPTKQKSDGRSGALPEKKCPVCGQNIYGQIII